MRVDDDQQVQLLERRPHLLETGLRVRRMAPEDHGLELLGLVHLVLRHQNAVDPAGHREALRLHQLLRREALQEPVVVDIPDPCPMLPRSGLQTVIAGQAVRQHAHVRGALHVVVAAEDVGPATRRRGIAQRQLHDAVGAGVVVAIGVLGAAHAPDDGAGTVVGQGPGDALHLRPRYAGDPLGLFRRPLFHFGPDLVHPVNALADELLVLPAVLEDVPENAPDDRDIGARTEAHILVGVRRRPREARITDDESGVIALLRLQDVLHRDRVGLGGVGANHEDGARVVHVVEVVGHRAVAPGVGHAGNRRRVTDARLMIAVVGAPEGIELAEQIGLFVAMLGGAQPIDGIGTGGLPNVEHLVADLVNRILPRHPLPLAADLLHRILEPTFAVREVADRGTLGAIGAEIDRTVPSRLLADPNPVIDLGDDGAADGAVRADGLHRLHARRGLGLGRLDPPQRQCGRHRGATGGQS